MAGAFFYAYNRSMDSTQNALNEATLEFFGPVDGFFGISLESLTRKLKQVNGEDLEILINSPGGDVFEGIAIGDMLMRRGGKTTTTAIGLAASIATVVLMAGDTVQMSESATLMIHDAWAFEAGDAETMEKTAEVLNKLSDTIATIYTNQIEKAGKLIDGDRDKTKERVRGMMKAETWLNANEALELGLIDAIVSNSAELEDIDMVGASNSDTDSKFLACLKSYKNTPNNILSKYNNKPMEDKKTLWQAIKAFFAPEIKAEAEAQKAIEPELSTVENQTESEMTKEEMIAALKEQGFEVSEKVEETPQPEEVQPTEAPKAESETAKLMAKFEAMEAEQAKLKAALKAAKFEAAAQPTAGEQKADSSKTKSTKLSAKNAAAFANLATILNNQ